MVLKPEKRASPLLLYFMHPAVLLCPASTLLQSTTAQLSCTMPPAQPHPNCIWSFLNPSRPVLKRYVVCSSARMCRALQLAASTDARMLQYFGLSSPAAAPHGAPQQPGSTSGRDAAAGPGPSSSSAAAAAGGGQPHSGPWATMADGVMPSLMGLTPGVVNSPGTCLAQSTSLRGKEEMGWWRKCSSHSCSLSPRQSR